MALQQEAGCDACLVQKDKDPRECSMDSGPSDWPTDRVRDGMRSLERRSEPQCPRQLAVGGMLGALLVCHRPSTFGEA